MRTVQTLARLREFGLLAQSETFFGVTTIVMHLSSPKCELHSSQSAILPKMLAQAIVTNFYLGAPRLKSPPGHGKSKAIHLLPPWTFTACSMVNSTFTFTFTFTFTQALNNLTQIFRGFLRSLQANSDFTVLVRPRSSPITSLPSDKSLSSIPSCWQHHLINNQIN
jgi:hypothetical protein